MSLAMGQGLAEQAVESGQTMAMDELVSQASGQGMIPLSNSTQQSCLLIGSVRSRKEGGAGHGSGLVR